MRFHSQIRRKTMFWFVNTIIDMETMCVYIQIKHVLLVVLYFLIE